MNNVIEYIGAEMQILNSALPEKPSIDVLQDFNDILLYKGMKQMNLLLEDKEEPSFVKSKVFNTLVGMGRYLEIRKENDAKHDDTSYILPEDLKIDEKKD